MNFYTMLSDVYDDLFPAEPSILRFLTDTFSSCQRVLDVACGTGTYTIPLWEQGKDVVGIDLSLPMIEQARGKLQQMFGRLPQGTSDNSPTTPQGRETDLFQAGDMLDLSRFPPESFQGLYCIGNSLPHLASEDEIRAALAQFHRVLAPEGILLLQTINFDRVRFDSRERFTLPTLKGRRAELVRFYTPGPDSDHLYFEAELSIPDGQRFWNRIPLFLLTRNRLEAWLQDTGFESLEWFGSYEGEAYDPGNSFLTIVQGRSRGK